MRWPASQGAVTTARPVANDLRTLLPGCPELLAALGGKPGTSGLRKKVTEFAQTHYLASFVQSVFDAVRLRERG